MEQENKSSKKPVSFEFIGPSRAIQKKIQIGKKGAAVAAQEFPPTFDLEKLKEYRKKTGPAPKLFMPTDQDKEEAEKEASQLSQEQSRAEVSSQKIMKWMLYDKKSFQIKWSEPQVIFFWYILQDFPKFRI